MSLVAHLARRFDQERRDAEWRAERLCAQVPRLAKIFFDHGAKKVVLFGSLAPGGRPHGASDLDLCVEGLSGPEYAEAVTQCWGAAEGVDVDVVRWEDASPALRGEIAYGVEVSRGVR
jgi:predicted nucleotidyltransferase